MLSKVAERLGLTKEEKDEENQGEEILMAESPVFWQPHQTTSVAKKDNNNDSTSTPWAWLHVSFALQRLDNGGTNKP